MARARDIWNKINGLSDEEIEAINWDNVALPSYKGKVVDEDNYSIYDVVKDPDFKTEFNKMPDDDAESLLWSFFFSQPDMYGDKGMEGVIDMLDNNDEPVDEKDIDELVDEKDIDELEDKDNPHDEELIEENKIDDDLYNESERILDKVVADVADDVIDEHIDKTRKNGASFVPRSKTGVKAMLEANKKGVKLSDKNAKNVGDCVSDKTMKNIIGTLSQYRW